MIPWLIVHVIDDYLIPGNLDGFLMLMGIFGGTVFLGYFADAVYTFSLQSAGQKAIAVMRQDLYEHALILPRTYFDQTPIGVTLSRLTSDTEAIGESLAVGVLSLFADLIKTAALITFLIYLNWRLTLVFAILLPLIFFIVTFLRKKLRYYYDSSRKSLAKATSFLQESLNGIKTIQLFASEKKVRQQFDQKNEDFFKAQAKSNIYDAVLFSIIDGLTSITMVLIIYYGADQVLLQTMTIGVLIGFINILGKIFIPIREFAQNIALIQRALSALEHIHELFRKNN